VTDLDALLPALRAGNSRAQEVLYQKLSPRMLAVCRRYLRDELEAEDALVGGFVKVFKYVVQFEGRGSFEGWVRRIMVHESLRLLRKREPLHLSVDDFAGQAAASTPATVESDMAAADLLALLEQLPTGYRTVFTLYAIDGYGHQEIADMLGITEGTSKSQLSKARAMLQGLLARRGHRAPQTAAFAPVPASKLILAF
jgi:RNA polymerase sigma factor (sigma-70 family)